MPNSNRRNFLKKSGAGVLPAFIPFTTVLAAGGKNGQEKNDVPPPASPVVKFFGDGEMFEPADYLTELQKAQSAAAIVKDRYGVGGAVEELEKKFATITGKEKAVFMPSGTMSNQLAIAVLSGEKSKVYLQETSHVYRDEADAAQSVFQKRLMPLAKDETFFTAKQLQDSIEALKETEAFDTGIGAVSIENPVRRTDGRAVPLEEIMQISAYCRSKNIKLHLDGARVFIASAWTGVSVKEYAAHFDTVYISLYKYLGASGGAMLCGPKDLMDKIPHLMKVHGGSVYGSWLNAAMALHRLEGFENRLQNARQLSVEIFAALNKLPGVKISPLDGGTNIYLMELAKEINGSKLQETLNKEFNIRMPRPSEKNTSKIAVNETLLYQSPEYIINAFKKAVK